MKRFILFILFLFICGTTQATNWTKVEKSTTTSWTRITPTTTTWTKVWRPLLWSDFGGDWHYGTDFKPCGRGDWEKTAEEGILDLSWKSDFLYTEAWGGRENKIVGISSTTTQENDFILFSAGHIYPLYYRETTRRPMGLSIAGVTNKNANVGEWDGPGGGTISGNSYKMFMAYFEFLDTQYPYSEKLILAVGGEVLQDEWGGDQ